MSLRFKTVIGVACIEAILLALLIFTVMGHMHENAEQALLKRSLTTAKLFASTAKDPVLSYDLASLDTFSQELIGNPDIAYVRIRETDGSILSSTGEDKYLNKEFIQDFNLKSVDDGVFDTTAIISESDIEYGRVEIGINTDSINSGIQDTQNLTTLIAVVEMTLVALFSLLLGNYLTRQLIVLRSAAKSISDGDYTKELEVLSKDEVGEVALAFNHMSSALRETKSSRDAFESELLELNSTLEEHVERRTEKINSQLLELQAANQTIADTQAKLLQSEKLASIGQLSAGVAHEINNPIAFVHSNISTLSQYVGVYQKLLDLCEECANASETEATLIKEKIRSIKEEEDLEFVNSDINLLIDDTLDGALRIKEIVKGLQEFSHTNGDSKSPCDVIQCLESTLKIVKNELKNRCSVIKEYGPIPQINANQGEINQVLLNLLMNARQAIGSEGTILVKTVYENEMVHISISDDGSGIDKNDVERLFDPFFTTKPAGVGTGLGLSISYGIIQDHGGIISVESENGKGSTFTISLPPFDEGIEKIAA